MTHFLSYTGPFSIGLAEEVIAILEHRIVLANFPNWRGQTQRRLVKVEENRLIVKEP